MKFGTGLVAIALMCALLALVAPMFAIMPDAAPQLDDFWNAEPMRDTLAAGGSAGEFLRQSLAYTGRVYQRWQGTWGAVFLMTLQPFTLGMPYYCLSLWALLVCVMASVFCLVWAVGRHVLGLTANERFILYALVMIPVTQLLPSPLEAYFYYVGGVFYTLYFGLSALLFGLITAFWFRQKGKKRNAAYYVLLPLVSIFVAGGNYTTGLIAAILLFAAAVYDLFIKKSRNALVAVSFLLFLAAFCLSLFAPGNSSRQVLSGGAAAVVTALVRSVIKALRCTVQWTTLPMLLLLAAGVPMAWRAAERSRFSYRLPLIPAAGFVLLIAAGFMSTYYTQGYAGAPRLLDIQYDMYVLGAFFNLFYVTGWCQKRLLPKLSLAAAPVSEAFSRLRARAVIGFTVLIALVAAANYDSFAGVLAAKSLATGESAAYHAEMLARFDTLESSPDAVVALPALTHQPELLLLADYGPDPARWENQRVANYFGKDSLYAVSGD